MSGLKPTQQDAVKQRLQAKARPLPRPFFPALEISLASLLVRSRTCERSMGHGFHNCSV